MSEVLTEPPEEEGDDQEARKGTEVSDFPTSDIEDAPELDDEPDVDDEPDE